MQINQPAANEYFRSKPFLSMHHGFYSLSRSFTLFLVANEILFAFIAHNPKALEYNTCWPLHMSSPHLLNWDLWNSRSANMYTKIGGICLWLFPFIQALTQIYVREYTTQVITESICKPNAIYNVGVYSIFGQFAFFLNTNQT